MNMELPAAHQARLRTRPAKEKRKQEVRNFTRKYAELFGPIKSLTETKRWMRDNTSLKEFCHDVELLMLTVSSYMAETCSALSWMLNQHRVPCLKPRWVSPRMQETGVEERLSDQSACETQSNDHSFKIASKKWHLCEVVL